MALENIVIVDDDSSIRNNVRKDISDSPLGFSYILHEAENGVAGFDVIKSLLKSKETISLVISDIEMPVQNGIEMLKIIRSHPKLEKLPVLMLSSVNDKDMIIDAINSGATNYLLKPWKSDDLIRKIKACL